MAKRKKILANHDEIANVDNKISNVDNAVIVDDNIVKERFKAAVMAIRKSQAAMRLNQFNIAVKLKEIYENKLYIAGGYKNVYEMAAAEFDYKKASTNNLIRIATLFLESDNEGKIRTIFAKGEIDFKYSQLQELLSLDSDKAKSLIEGGKITVDSTAKEIREIVKETKQAEKISTNENSEQSADSLVTRQPENESESENQSESAINVDSEISEIELLKRQLEEMTKNFQQACEIGNKLADENKRLKTENAELEKEIVKLREIRDNLEFENVELQDKLDIYESYQPEFGNI